MRNILVDAAAKAVEEFPEQISKEEAKFILNLVGLLNTYIGFDDALLVDDPKLSNVVMISSASISGILQNLFADAKGVKEALRILTEVVQRVRDGENEADVLAELKDKVAGTSEEDFKEDEVG